MIIAITSKGVGHSLGAPGFKPRPVYVYSLFHYSRHLVTFSSCYVDSIVGVYRSVRETATFRFNLPSSSSSSSSSLLLSSSGRCSGADVKSTVPQNSKFKSDSYLDMLVQCLPNESPYVSGMTRDEATKTTHSPTDSLSPNSLSHSLTHSLIHRLTHSLSSSI